MLAVLFFGSNRRLSTSWRETCLASGPLHLVLRLRGGSCSTTSRGRALTPKEQINEFVRTSRNGSAGFPESATPTSPGGNPEGSGFSSSPRWGSPPAKGGARPEKGLLLGRTPKGLKCSATCSDMFCLCIESTVHIANGMPFINWIVENATRFVLSNANLSPTPQPYVPIHPPLSLKGFDVSLVCLARSYEARKNLFAVAQCFNPACCVVHSSKASSQTSSQFIVVYSLALLSSPWRDHVGGMPSNGMGCLPLFSLLISCLLEGGFSYGSHMFSIEQCHFASGPSSMQRRSVFKSGSSGSHWLNSKSRGRREFDKNPRNAVRPARLEEMTRSHLTRQIGMIHAGT